MAAEQGQQLSDGSSALGLGPASRALSRRLATKKCSRLHRGQHCHLGPQSGPGHRFVQYKYSCSDWFGLEKGEQAAKAQTRKHAHRRKQCLFGHCYLWWCCPCDNETILVSTWKAPTNPTKPSSVRLTVGDPNRVESTTWEFCDMLHCNR